MVDRRENFIFDFLKEIIHSNAEFDVDFKCAFFLTVSDILLEISVLTCHFWEVTKRKPFGRPTQQFLK